MPQGQSAAINMDYLASVVRLACVLDDLKTRIRTGWKVWKVRSRRLESISEHSHGCLLLANLLYPIYPERDLININKVNMMLIYHEIGEAIIGDVPMTDKKKHSRKAQAERAAWKKLLYGLPYGQEVYDLLMEFDKHETPEAKFAYYIDKLEAIKYMKRYADSHKFHRLKWIQNHSELVRNNEDVQELIANGAKTAVDVWFAEAAAPYKDDAFFMAVHRRLRMINTNIKPEDI